MSARHKHTTQRRDIHAEVTAALIAAIGADPGNPSLPWRRNAAPLFLPDNALTKKSYNGINVVTLWVSAERHAYAASVWATYKQWSELDCQVRKGEKSSLVVFYKEFETDPNPDDESDDGKRRVARASYVFNAAQVEGCTVLRTAASASLPEQAVNTLSGEIFFAPANPRFASRGDKPITLPFSILIWD